jgi:NAD(P)-dependent dehydrogenase (short-subunit alcohol dehydrogenase family)
MMSESPELAGKVALVTGGARNMGRAFAQALARNGADVVVHHHGPASEDDAEQTANLVREQGGRAIVFEGDLATVSVVNSLFDEAFAAFGRVDIVVNNAGVTSVAKAVDEPLEDFRRTLDVNVSAAFDLSRTAARHMMKQETGGSIVNIASIVGMVGLGRMPQAGYAASKGALVNLTRELAAQWARHGVRVNAIAPGWFHTEMTEELFASSRGADWVGGLTPMGRHGELHELTGALLLLAGPASSYITGIVLPVDGGWTAV